jgi:hypothetical protein
MNEQNARAPTEVCHRTQSVVVSINPNPLYSTIYITRYSMKAVFSLAMVVLLASSMAFAQASGVSTVVFSLSNPLTVTGADVDWGELSAGTTYTISPAGEITPPPPGTSPGDLLDPIQWTVEGSLGAMVNVVISMPGFFQSDGGIRVPYTVNTQSAGWGVDIFDNTVNYVPFDPRVPEVITLVDGLAAVQLGGILTIPANAGANDETDFTGTFILSASYTGL